MRENRRLRRAAIGSCEEPTEQARPLQISRLVVIAVVVLIVVVEIREDTAVVEITELEPLVTVTVTVLT